MLNDLPPEPASIAKRRAGMTAIAAAALLAAVLVGLRAVELGVESEWTWRWQECPMWDRAWLPACFFAIVAAVLAAAHLHAERMRLRDEVAAVGLLVALGLALQLAMGYLGKGGGQEVVFATHTPWVAGYFEAARNDVGTDGAALARFLADYPAYIRGLPMQGHMIHVGQHPPGNILFYWCQLRLFALSPGLTAAVLRAADALTYGGADAFELADLRLEPFERAAVWSSFFMLSFLCALAVAPVYLVARQLAGCVAGLAAAGLYLTTPSLHLFSPHVDQLHMPLSAAVCAVWVWALRRGSAWRGALTGVGLGICLFVSLHFVALAALCVLSAVLWCWRGEARPRWRLGVRLCAWLAAGLAGVVAVQYLCLSHNVLRVWWICLAKHETFYDYFPRTYWKWVLANLLEFGLFTGAATVCLWALWAVAEVRGWRSGRRLGPVQAICVAAALILLALNFSGKNLSEVARLWMFLMPLAAAAGGAMLAKLAAGTGMGWVWAVVAAQFVQVAVFKLRLDVFSIYR